MRLEPDACSTVDVVVVMGATSVGIGGGSTGFGTSIGIGVGALAFGISIFLAGAGAGLPPPPPPGPFSGTKAILNSSGSGWVKICFGTTAKKAIRATRSPAWMSNDVPNARPILRPSSWEYTPSAPSQPEADSAPRAVSLSVEAGVGVWLLALIGS